MRQMFFALCVVFIGASLGNAEWPAGTTEAEIFQVYPYETARTYRRADNELWISFDSRDALSNVVTFHFVEGTLQEVRRDDREEIVREYMGEYVSQAFRQGYPYMLEGIRQALVKVPWDVFLAVTSRRRPVLFTEYHFLGVGRFANSSEIVKTEDDVPSMQDGLTIIKLSTEMEEAANAAAVAGVVAHELAHRFREDYRRREEGCALEKEANALVRDWGLDQELSEAQRVFGHGSDTPGGSACHAEAESENEILEEPIEK